MKRSTAGVLLVALAVAALALTRWPRLGQVETSRTPEYPDLKDLEYGGSEDAIVKAVRDSVDALGWRFVGGGQGPGGSQVQAVAEPLPGPLAFEVTVRVQPVPGNRRRSRVHVLSRTSNGWWDFGHNARLLRKLQEELDRRLASR